MPYLLPNDEWDRDQLRSFGVQLRRARLMAGLSQVALADRSGVAQTTISRLERGVAPAFKLYRLVRLGQALGTRMPLGFCPHHHYCSWRRLRQDGTEDPRHEPIGGAEYFDALMEERDA